MFADLAQTFPARLLTINRSEVIVRPRLMFQPFSSHLSRQWKLILDFHRGKLFQQVGANYSKKKKKKINHPQNSKDVTCLHPFCMLSSVCLGDLNGLLVILKLDSSLATCVAI